MVALHLFHSCGIELREGDISSDREDADLVHNPVLLLFPQGGPHADGETFDNKPALAGNDKVTPFVDEDGDAEQHHHHYNNIKHFKHGGVLKGLSEEKFNVNVKHGCCEKDAVDHVKNTAEPVDHGIGVFDVDRTFEHGFDEITGGSDDREEEAEHQRVA